MSLKYSIIVVIAAVISRSHSEFVKVSEDGLGFVLDGRPFVARGFNYFEGVWIAMANENGGNRSRLDSDLESLKKLGSNTIRVMAGALGPDTEPYRWSPAIFPSPNSTNEAALEGLDYLLYALQKHQMKAIISLADFWQCSGGFAQYVNWATQEEIPYPPSFPDYTGDTDAFVKYTRRFYSDPKIRVRCQKMLRSHIRTVLGRNNTVSGIPYVDDPAIMAWEITNEAQAPPSWWIHSTGKYIKKLDSRHLLTSGLEGKEEDNCTTFNMVHSSAYVDFATVHCWVENWGIYKPYNMSASNLDEALSFAKSFLTSRSQCSSESFKKPVLLQEFGMARDGEQRLPWDSPDPQNRFSPAAPTTHRDEYFKQVCYHAASLMRTSYVSGLMVWAWAGEGRPADNGPRRIGDPPHEPPGWYSVFDSDMSTLEILHNCFQILQHAGNDHGLAGESGRGWGHERKDVEEIHLND